MRSLTRGLTKQDVPGSANPTGPRARVRYAVEPGADHEMLDSRAILAGRAGTALAQRLIIAGALSTLAMRWS